MSYEFTYIWKYNPIIGSWVMVRDSLIENAAQWLAIFRGDEPCAQFKVSKRRPIKAPKTKGV